jgi:hypothetical protein
MHNSESGMPQKRWCATLEIDRLEINVPNLKARELGNKVASKVNHMNM